MITRKQATRDAKRLYHLCVVEGLLDDSRVRQVVQHFIKAGYRSGPVILEHFSKFIRLDREQHTAQVETATPLPPDVEAQTKAQLTLRYGPGLLTQFVSRPALIGGMRIQVGSDLYDGSVLAKLASIETSF